VIPALEPDQDEGTAPRSPILYTGVWTGALLVATLGGSLFLANRAPWLDPHAFLRNVVCAGLIVLIMTIPVARFYSSPISLFVSGTLSWAILSLSYWLAGMYFENLENPLGKTTFELLILGAVMYGIAAVACWVVSLIFVALHPPVEPAHRRVSQPTSRLR
jgi:hypothetical protein